MSGILLKAQKTIPLREAKTNCHNINNFVQTGAVCGLKAGAVKGQLSASKFHSLYFF